MRARVKLVALPFGIAALVLLAGCGGDGNEPASEAGTTDSMRSYW